MARMLLRAGADPNQVAQDDDGLKRTPIHQIALYREGPYFAHPTHPKQGLLLDRLRGLISELVRAGADYDAMDSYGITPFLAALMSGNVTALWYLYELRVGVGHVSHAGWDVLAQLAVARYHLLELIQCVRAMNIKGVDPDRRFKSGGNTEWSPVGIFNDRMSSPRPPGLQRVTQIEVFAFYALITEISRRNWELRLFLETKEELEVKGHVNSIRKWLGSQWQMIHDNDEFSRLVWDTETDVEPEYYSEDEDSIDYDMEIIWGKVEQVEVGVDLSKEAPMNADGDELEEFFDARE